MKCSAHLETLHAPVVFNTNKRATTYCLLDNMSDGIESISKKDHVPTKTNKRKHNDLGPDSMFLGKYKRVPSSPEEAESDQLSHIRNIRSDVLHKL